jgi:hypothetical protein
MAKRTVRRHTDRHGLTVPAVEPPTVSATCEAGLRHDRCRGRLHSLLVPAGTPCGCPCHQQGRAA